MQVVERNDDGPLCRDALEQLGEDLEGAELQRFGRKRFEQSGSLWFEVEAENGRQVWIGFGATPGEGFLRLPTQFHAQSKFGLGGADFQPVAKKIAIGPVGQRLAVRDAAPFHPCVITRRGRALAELGGEAALADAGIADDEQYRSAAGRKTIDELERHKHLGLASHHRRRWFGRAPQGCLASAGDREGDHRVDLTFELKAARLAPVKEACDLPLGDIRDQDPVAGGGGLESRGRIHRVANHAVFDALPNPDPPGDDFAGMDTDPHREAFDAQPRRTSSAYSRAAAMMSSPARTARSGSSSWATGAPKSASRPSPIRVVTVPPYASTAWMARLIAPPITSFASSGSNRSLSAVDPATSANKAVTMRRSSRNSAIHEDLKDGAAGWGPRGHANLPVCGSSGLPALR